MAIPFPQTFHCFQKGPDFSNTFSKQVHQLYRRNAQAVSLNVGLVKKVELQMTTVTVTNSLVFAGSMRMQGKTRDILNAEQAGMSFNDSMTCVAASSSQFVLEKLYPSFSSDSFLSLAGKPSCGLSDSLLESVCRGLVVGTGELYEEYRKSMNKSSVNCGEPSTPFLDQTIQNTEPKLYSTNSMRVKAKDSIEPQSFERNKISSNSPSINAESIISTTHLSIAKSDELLHTRDGPSKSPYATLSSRSTKVVDHHQRRASAIFDENTPPRKSSAIVATHRRFVSLPFGRLPSKFPLADPDVDGSNIDDTPAPRSPHRNLDGAALSPLPQLKSFRHDQTSTSDISTAVCGPSGRLNSSAQTHMLKSSYSLAVIAKDANIDCSAGGSSPCEAGAFNKTQPRQRRTSTPAVFNRTSLSPLRPVLNGNLPFDHDFLDIPRPRQRRTSTPATFGSPSSVSVKTRLLNVPSPGQRRTSTPAALNVPSSPPRRRSASVTLSLREL